MRAKQDWVALVAFFVGLMVGGYALHPVGRDISAGYPNTVTAVLAVALGAAAFLITKLVIRRRS